MQIRQCKFTNFRISNSANPNSKVQAANGGVVEQEKRVRREIANSNERRRMQSINAGFQTLRSLLPRRDGEKISKVMQIHISFIIFKKGS